MLKFFVTAMALVAVAGLTAVSAQEPPPTPTSAITIRFVHDGKPLIRWVGGEPRIFANGKECDLPQLGVVLELEVTRWGVSWPPISDVDPPDCSQLGAVVRICFGDLCTEVVWQGVDIVVDLEAPDQPDKSAVTARFVREGQPVQVTLTGWDYEADGDSCLTTRPVNLPVENIIAISRFWPTDQSFTPACQTVGSVIVAKFSTEEFGAGEGTFVWSGEDVVFDVTLSGAPGELPITGGPPGDAGLTAVSAQEATPTPTSTITVRFVRDGQPVTIDAGASLQRVMADGVECSIIELPLFGPTAGYTIGWPLGGLPQPPECSKGPATTLRLETGTEFGLLFAEFVWTGGDMTVDIEVPAGTTVPPGELPITGGPPGDGTPTRNWVVVALVAGFSILAVPVAAFLYRRS